MSTDEQVKEFLGKYEMTKSPTFMGIKVDESWKKKDLLMLINYLGEEIHFRHAGLTVGKYFEREGIRKGV